MVCREFMKPEKTWREWSENVQYAALHRQDLK